MYLFTTDVLQQQQKTVKRHLSLVITIGVVLVIFGEGYVSVDKYICTYMHAWV